MVQPIESIPAPRVMSNWSAAFFTKLHRWRSLVRRRWWVLAMMLCVSLLVQVYRISTAPPVYVSQGRMMVPPQIRSYGEKTQYQEDQTNFIGTQIELMRSGQMILRAHELVRAAAPQMQKIPVVLNVYVLPRTAIFVLQATGGEPEYVRRFLDALMESFIAFKEEQRMQISEKTLTTITEELIKLDRELETALRALNEFQKNNNLVFLEEQGNTAAKYLNDLQKEMADMKREANLFEMMQSGAEGASSSTEAMSSLLENGDNDYARAKRQIQMLQTQRNELARYLKEAHPKLQGLQEEIERQKGLLDVYRDQAVEDLKSRGSALAMKIANTEQSIAEWQVRSRESGTLMAEYRNLKEDIDRIREQRDRMRETTQTMDVATTLTQLNITILEQASAAGSTRGNVLKGLLLALLAGVAAGGGILFLLDRIDDRVNSFTEFREHFDEEVLGQVPQEKAKSGSDRVALLTPDDPRQMYAESMRNVRSSLLYMAVQGERPKMMLVTSAIPGEGKSTIAANLAVTMAFAGSQVLLVDADLRKGILHEDFGMDPSPGLAETLEQREPWRGVCRETGVEGLTLITRGRARGPIGEMLLSPAAVLFLREARAEFNYVVIDSPPVLAADDTPSLAPQMDGVIMVMRSSFTSSRMTQNSLDLLRQRQANVMGIVFNCIDTNLPDYYHYQYYRSYYSAPVPGGETERKSKG